MAALTIELLVVTAMTVKAVRRIDHSLTHSLHLVCLMIELNCAKPTSAISRYMMRRIAKLPDERLTALTNHIRSMDVRSLAALRQVTG